MDDERFDINAETTSPLPRPQILKLLQPYLVEQFKLTFHQINKAMDIYALVVDKGGPKMKTSAEKSGRFMISMGPRGAVLERAPGLDHGLEAQGDEFFQRVWTPVKPKGKPALSALDHAHRAGVARQAGVGGQQSQPLDRGLRDQYAVKRVLVQPGKLAGGQGVGPGDGQFEVAVLQQSAPQLAEVNFQGAMLAVVLDRQLPNAGHAEPKLVGSVLDECLGLGGAPFGRVGRPQQQMGVEQKVHSWSSSSVP